MTVTYAEYKHSRAHLGVRRGEPSWESGDSTSDLERVRFSDVALMPIGYEGVVRGGTQSAWGDVEVRVGQSVVTFGTINNASTAVEVDKDKLDWFVGTREFPGREAAREGLVARLLASLSAEPLEAGVEHPAEEIIHVLLRDHSGLACRSLRQAFTEALSDRPTLAADLLRCMSRAPWLALATVGPGLVEAALGSSSTDAREAGVFATENWGNSELAALLRAKTATERVSWLKDYADAVVREIEVDEA